MAAMRSLLAAAVAVAAAAVHSAGAGPHTETIYSHANTTIAAFAQDGALVAWFSPSRTRCNTVHVISLANPLQTTLPLQGGARNVTCRWVVGSTPVTPRARRRRTSSGRCGAVADPVRLPPRRGRRRRRAQGAPLPGDRAHEPRLRPLARRHRRATGRRSSTASPRSTTSTRPAASPARAPATSRSPAAASTASSGARRRSSSPGTGPGGAVASRRRPAPSRMSRRRRRQAGPAACGRRPADRGRRRADRRLDLARQPAGDAARDRAHAARSRDARAHAARATPRVVRPRDRRTPDGSVPVPGKTSPELDARPTSTIVYHVGRSIRAVDVADAQRAHARRAPQRSPSGCRSRAGRLAWAENLKTARAHPRAHGQAVIG